TVGANGDWTQPAGNSACIAAWDVSVRNKNNTEWIKGRVYTNVMNMVLPIDLSLSQSFFGTVYALTKDGYVYRINGNGFQGIYYTFLVNNVGFYAPDLPADEQWDGADWLAANPTPLPSYKSFDYSNYDQLVGTKKWLQDPRIEDTPTGI